MRVPIIGAIPWHTIPIGLFIACSVMYYYCTILLCIFYWYVGSPRGNNVRGSKSFFRASRAKISYDESIFSFLDFLYLGIDGSHDAIIQSYMPVNS